MAFRMKGFTPFTKKQKDKKTYHGGVLPEVKLTAKHTRGSRRLAKERELHKNPVIKAIHKSTDKAAKAIGDVAQVFSGLRMVGAVNKLANTKRAFNLQKYKDPIVKKVKKGIKTGVKYGPIVADDVVMGVVDVDSNRKNRQKRKK